MDLKEEALQIKRYTDMVMAYLRLESESGDYVFENVDLDEVIASVIREFSIEFIYRKIPIDFQKTKLIVLSDRKWLRFALEQFLSNAIKYSEGQKITIRNIGYDLFIEDRGIGISKQDLERIREKRLYRTQWPSLLQRIERLRLVFKRHCAQTPPSSLYD